MVRPSQSHAARLRLTTKQVNGGYYKGNRTGSMGAHTEWGGYIIDYRKVRNFNCPDLSQSTLTPFVTMQVDPRNLKFDRLSGRSFLAAWKEYNREEYEGMREQWREHLQESGEIPREIKEQPAEKYYERSGGQEESWPTRRAYYIDENVQAQARKDAIAQLEADSTKSKSWIGRIFKRG